MRYFLRKAAIIAVSTAIVGFAYGQAPPDRGGDRPPRPADASPPRDAPRDDDDRPPPAKAGPRGRGGAPDQPGPGGRGAPGMSGGPNFQPPGRRGGGGGFGEGGFGRGGFGGEYGGSAFGGGGYGMRSGGMPGPGMFPGEAPDDPEMRSLMEQDVTLDRKTHEMAARIRESRGDERTRLKGELQDIVNKHFDVRQKRRELSLKRMEEEIKRLRDAINDRNKSRDSIVENRVRELTGEPRDLDF